VPFQLISGPCVVGYLRGHGLDYRQVGKAAGLSSDRHSIFPADTLDSEKFAPIISTLFIRVLIIAGCQFQRTLSA